MPVIPRIRHIEFLSAPPENPESGGADVRVHLEDGSASSFGVLTPNCVGHRMNEAGQDFCYGAPALFVKRLDQAGLAKAAEAMAADMSGFWLRYYNSTRDEKKRAKGRKR
jgi:hypothetical protein